MFALWSLIFQHNAVYIESFSKNCRRNLSSAFLALSDIETRDIVLSKYGKSKIMIRLHRCTD